MKQLSREDKFDLIIQFYILDNLVLLLMEERKMTLEQALDTLYSSDTLSFLEDMETELYLQSPLYIYEMLEEELEEKSTHSEV